MKSDSQNRPDQLNIRWLGAAAGVAIALAPVGVHARNAQPSLSLPVLAPPANGPLNFNPPPAVVSWLDMVSATQAAQPNWMTPLVTVTPRLEQELRSDFYGQQNGTGSQGNGHPILWNTTLQYHFMQYFWPELEVNYEYWPNGEHGPEF
jgi:hypothetical protein